jgi:TonB-linked SusC/RagA family outer membrane protein
MNYNVSANGGTDHFLYNVSANYFKQEGIIRGSEFERISLRVNNHYELNSFFDIGHNIVFVLTDKKIAPGVVNTALRTSPITTPFDSLGEFSDASIYSSTANAEASIFYNNNNEQTYRGIGNVFADIHFLKDFTFRSNFGGNIEFLEGKNFRPVFDVSSIQFNEVSDLEVRNNRSNSWLWENTLSYAHEWEHHRVNAVGGITAQEFYSEALKGRSEALLGETEEFYFLDAGTEVEGGDALNNNGSTWSMVSYLFRVNYTFLDRYLFTGSFRADGSSKFGKENRYAYFPSFAVGWNLTNEPFMKDQNILDRLKLRSSWGQIGNEKINSEAAIAVVDPNLNNAIFGTSEFTYPAGTPTSLANSQLRWEETTQSNIGVELGVLNNRLVAEIDYYRRVTSDILTPVPIPKFIGSQDDPVVNAAKVLNRGFDFGISWRDTRGDLSYHAGFVGSTVYNEVLELGEGKEEIFAGGLGFGGILGTRTIVGLPIGSYYGFLVDGVFQNEEELNTLPKRGGEKVGDLRFQDLNGDGLINDEDDRNFIGNPIPDFIYGFSLGAEYKGFDLNVEFNGQKGNDLINAKKMARFGNYNFETSYLERWHGEGTSDFEPRVTNSGHNYEFSNRFVENGSFLRLRNIQLGYTLPSRISENLKLGMLRVYVSGTNLVTWTDYTGYTPEVSSENVLSVGIDSGRYPVSKTVLFGLNVAF